MLPCGSKWGEWMAGNKTRSLIVLLLFLSICAGSVCAGSGPKFRKAHCNKQEAPSGILANKPLACRLVPCPIPAGSPPALSEPTRLRVSTRSNDPVASSASAFPLPASWSGRDRYGGPHRVDSPNSSVIPKFLLNLALLC
jgi:hypothetical protein